MSKLGDYIREIEYQVNMQVNGTKELAYNATDIYLEPGGTLKGKDKKKEEVKDDNNKPVN